MALGVIRWEVEPRASRVIWFKEGSTRHSPTTKGGGDIVPDFSTGVPQLERHRNSRRFGVKRDIL